ncbi:MAG: GNAT family N-acetyltransferase [Saprospiraceae bacterium]|nr:GNAT family N-acetyltransferase [Saprospiraceae bacterium]
MINFTILETERMILKGITSEQMKYIFSELPKDEIKSMLGHRSSEAVKAILQLGFQELELNRIEANVDILNIPSIKILEKNNFRKEGILREHVYHSDHFSDSVFYSILQKEYVLH